MDRVDKQESQIIRLTRWSVTLSLSKKGSEAPKKDGERTIFGVDAAGNERVYAQVSPDQWEKWSKTDALWIQAQSSIFQRLLSDPRTKDTVIKINLKAALDKGDEETATTLWNALSETAKAELIAKPSS